jgi:hypothetical protein
MILLILATAKSKFLQMGLRVCWYCSVTIALHTHYRYAKINDKPGYIYQCGYKRGRTHGRVCPKNHYKKAGKDIPNPI